VRFIRVKIFFAAQLFVVFGFVATAFAILPLQLASTVWPPFTDIAGRDRIAIDIVETALGQIGYRVEAHILPNGELTKALRQKIFDGSFALWNSQKREEFLLYSRPYLENRLVLVSRKESVLDVDNFSMLANKKIGIVAGYAYGPVLRKQLDLFLYEGDDHNENLKKLLAGELDGILVDEVVAHTLIEHYPEKTRKLLHISDKVLLTRTLHLALQKSLPHAQEIIDRFNRQLTTLISSGEYNQILGFRWILADIDGDGIKECILGNGYLTGNDAPQKTYNLFRLDLSHLDNPGDSGPDTVKDRQPGKSNENIQFWIEGKKYEDWERIPEKYKHPEPKSHEKTDEIHFMMGIEF